MFPLKPSPGARSPRRCGGSPRLHPVCRGGGAAWKPRQGSSVCLSVCPTAARTDTLLSPPRGTGRVGWFGQSALSHSPQQSWRNGAAVPRRGKAPCSSGVCRAQSAAQDTLNEGQSTPLIEGPWSQAAGGAVVPSVGRLHTRCRPQGCQSSPARDVLSRPAADWAGPGSTGPFCV